MTNDEKKTARDAAEDHRVQAARYRADAEFAPHKSPTLFDQAEWHDAQAREIERKVDPRGADAKWLRRLRKCDNITASERRLIGMLDRDAAVLEAARTWALVETTPPQPSSTGVADWAERRAAARDALLAAVRGAS